MGGGNWRRDRFDRRRLRSEEIIIQSGKSLADLPLKILLAVYKEPFLREKRGALCKITKNREKYAGKFSVVLEEYFTLSVEITVYLC